jgi:hypothetical protein
MNFCPESDIIFPPLIGPETVPAQANSNRPADR